MSSKRLDIGRQRRKVRVRKKVRGTEQRPRICVFRSNKHIYAQVISDAEGKTLASVSTLSEGLADQVKGNKGVEAAKQVGAALAKVCKEKISPAWSSTATGLSTMAGSRPWPTARAKPAWIFNQRLNERLLWNGSIRKVWS